MNSAKREWGSERELALSVAREAAALVMTGWRTKPVITKKGAIDLVTEFDVRSEALIRERLERALPGAHVVAEEGKGDAAHELVWWVDPIDGTTNFAHGHPFFAVSIGLAERGVPVAGAVIAPALGREWACARGQGATRDGVPCAVSGTSSLDEALVATGFPYDRRTSAENNLSEFVALKLVTQGIRRCGAAALDLAFVADGTYDGYWEQKLHPWDSCAGIALVTEAGGHVTSYDGTPFSLAEGRVVATNAKFHDDLVRELQKARGHSPTF